MIWLCLQLFLHLITFSQIQQSDPTLGTYRETNIVYKTYITNNMIISYVTSHNANHWAYLLFNKCEFSFRMLSTLGMIHPVLQKGGGGVGDDKNAFMLHKIRSISTHSQILLHFIVVYIFVFHILRTIRINKKKNEIKEKHQYGLKEIHKSILKISTF